MSRAKNGRRSRTGPSWGGRWVVCAFSLLAFLNATGAFAEGLTARFGTRVVWKSTPPENPLLRGNGKLTGNPEVDLRNLENDPRPSASRHLVHLSTQHAVLNAPKHRLTLVRALSRHESRTRENNSVRVEILRSLIRLFMAEDEIGQLATDPDPENGALRHLARGTAAMALARSQHPLALKKLLATALSGDQIDPVGARLALTALRSLPKKALLSRELVHLFSAAAITRISDPAESSRPIATENMTPESLVERAKKENATAGNTFSGKDQPAESDDNPALAQILGELLRRKTLPRSFSHVRAWEKAFRNDPVWTLRALALLSTRINAPVSAFGRRVALLATESSSELERSAGAWCLATVSPDSVGELLKKNDGVITRAILRQASEGKVAHIVADFLNKKQIAPDLEHLGFGMVFQDPELWSSFSTASLRKHQTEHSPTVLAALSSRLRVTGRGLGPDVSEVKSWLLASSPEVRSATAWGLSDRTSGSALGLLFWAYRKESNPQTRQAIVASIVRTPLAKNSEFLNLLAIDPDPRCRDLLQEGVKPIGPGVHLSWSSRRVTSITDREGHTFDVAPAPDGFVGIVRSSF